MRTRVLTWHRREVRKEAIGVKDSASLILVFQWHTLLHGVVIALDFGTAGPSCGEATVPVDDHAVHVEQDDRWRELEGDCNEAGLM